VYELVSALKNRIFEHRIVTGKADKPLKGRYATLMAHLDAVLEGLEPKVQHKARTLRVARRAAGLSGVPNSAAEPCID
jgi:hypothetical protein